MPRLGAERDRPGPRGRGAVVWTLAALLAGGVSGCAAPPPSEPAGTQTGTTGVAPLVARAGSALERGDYDTAIALYGDALERTPWNTRLSRRLAVAHAERAGHRRGTPGVAGLRAAERDLRRALEIDPTDATFRRNLGVVLLELAPFVPGAEAGRLRAEARGLAPEEAARAAGPDAAPLQHEVERRLDLAFELLERGQYEIGLRRLESLRSDYPDRGDVMRLLAQGYVIWGSEMAVAADRAGAARAFGRAVELYADLLPCDGARCSRGELRTAHRNRVVVLLESGRRSDARLALDAAERAGLEFPRLRAEVAGPR
ncbi:MAG: hypothetical protein J4G09_09075 [Proteobacteria bacterium]|nr:hypothetical protein [Pseudomonadota bacterium]